MTRGALLPALLAFLCGCAGDGVGPFVSGRFGDHPLAGRIFQEPTGTAISWHELERRAEAARFVLLGETHDNPDHHRLQARLIERLARSPRPPALVFEMLDHDRQADVDAFLAAGLRDPDAFAARIGWAESGWPEFSLYRPVFAAGLAAGLPIVAAGVRAGAPANSGDSALRTRFGLDEPLAPAEQAERIDEMFVGHCELIPREQLAAMVEMQRVRDARMAEALLRGAELRGSAVLVAGAGHTQRSGVPALLARAGATSDSILSVGFLEVDPDARGVEDTDAAEFDVAVFTPAAEREDPCELLRRHFERGSRGTESP